MAPEWIYLLKVNAGITLFYAFYKLFCQRDTFFAWRRFALLSFLAISFLYPLIDISNWVQEQPAMVELADYYATLIEYEEIPIVQATNVPQAPDTVTLLMYIYFIGVALLSLRFLIQLGSIFRMRWMGKAVERDGQRIISMPTETNPFSFFRWIFVYEPQLQKENWNEILTHEQTHVQQGHSFDVIISELANIVCWFNPFSWLLKSEIRLNLEYLADNQVAEVLQDTKVYQYHLLGLASQNKKTGLYNNFNVSHLKRRIIMMNKKRTCMAGHLKYALFAPLAFALLLASNISCTSTEKQDEQASKMEVKADENGIYTVAEEMPMYPGGIGELMKFLQKNIQYPASSIEKGIQGRVIVQFVVQKDGSIEGAKVARGVDPLLDKEALRVINQMPKWEPGKVKGQAVPVKYTVPVMFKLSNDNPNTAETKKEAKVDENGVYMVCDQMPTFPGGMRECMNYLSKNIKYPEECKKEGVQGRVIIQFVVDKEGNIRDAKIARGIHPSLDKEALRVIEAMPKWEPGKQDGKAVSVKYTVPVNFKAQ